MRVIGTRRGTGHPGPGQLSSTAMLPSSIFAMWAVLLSMRTTLSVGAGIMKDE